MRERDRGYEEDPGLVGRGAPGGFQDQGPCGGRGGHEAPYPGDAYPDAGGPPERGGDERGFHDDHSGGGCGGGYGGDPRAFDNDRGGGRGGGGGDPRDFGPSSTNGMRGNRVSSNTFATGSNQNAGNVLTDTPSTRVLAPPGGASSFAFGWNDPPDSGPQRSPGQQRGGSVAGSMAGDRPTTGHEAWGCTSSKGDVEGSKPRSYKPGIRLNAPPGGGGTFSPDWDTETERRNGGKKLCPGAGGAGNNKDVHGTDAHRYYQTEEERPGKKATEQQRPQEDRASRDSHRYYLEGDGRADRVPGKAQCSPQHGSDHGGAADHLNWPETGSCAGASQAGSSARDVYRERQLHGNRPF